MPPTLERHPQVNRLSSAAAHLFEMRTRTITSDTNGPIQAQNLPAHNHAATHTARGSHARTMMVRAPGILRPRLTGLQAYRLMTDSLRQAAKECQSFGTVFGPPIQAQHLPVDHHAHRARVPRREPDVEGRECCAPGTDARRRISRPPRHSRGFRCHFPAPRWWCLPSSG